MDLEYALKTLGLSEKEARVYLAGLALGPASVQALSQKAKVKRTTVYEILQALKEKELFKETVRAKKHVFVAAHPNQLKADLNIKQQTLDKVFDKLDNLAKTEKGKPNVLYHDTLQSIHRIYEDALKKTKKETLGIGSQDIARRLGEDWLKRYVAKRKKRGIGARTVIDAPSKKWQKRDAEDKRTTRILPGNRSLPVNIEILDDVVVIASLEGETFGLSVESKKVSEALKAMFEVVWNASK